MGHELDSLVFISVAFGRTIPAGVLGPAIVTQWLAKVTSEAVATPLPYRVVARLKRVEGRDPFDRDGAESLGVHRVTATMAPRGGAVVRDWVDPRGQSGRQPIGRPGIRRFVPILMGVALVAAVWLAPPAAAEVIIGLKPVEPQPTAASLKPGLAVQYTYAIMNHVNDMKGRPVEAGSPILHLDWVMGTGRVLTSKAHEGVGAILTGLIQFEKPGVYGFNVTSNDGVRVEIGGKLIHEDPGVHLDTTSDRIDLKIDPPGWYPITITDFQKRSTATLVVRWTGPGEQGRLQPVAPKALAHMPK